MTDARHDQSLIDTFGRRHNNLRVSVTDRCNIRCVYCMPETVTFLPRRDLLSFEEIARVVRAVAPLGINKIRLTGGEPLVRKDLHLLVREIAAIDGIHDIGLTTNGLLLAAQARVLWNEGLRRINISLDTLDPARFLRLTRRTGVEQVIEGIDAALAVGFQPVKINAVAIKHLTEPDVVPLARFARDRGLELRFIEYMPLDVANQWERSKVLFAEEIIQLLEAEFGGLVAAVGSDARAASSDYDYADGKGRVGFIASVSRPFCMSCNRLRLTADGKLRNCLFALEETDLRATLRAGGHDDAIRQAVIESVRAKWEGHEINTARFIKPERLMHAIGG